MTIFEIVNRSILQYFAYYGNQISFYDRDEQDAM